MSPRDELELQLAAIWQKALGVKNIGINDNFFELGGHSLLAAQMFAQMENKIGVNLPLATLFQAPTIGQIAEILRQKDWVPTWSSLIPIRVNGTKPPLFLFHAAEGNVLLYKDLVHYIGDDQPVYGLQSQGLDGSVALQTDLEDMADKYIKEMKSIQSDGPYYLAGYCMGGAIALEVAQQLKQKGCEVMLVAMIETYNIQDKPGKIPLFVRLLHKMQNVAFQIGNLFLSRSSGWHDFFRQKARVEIGRFKIKFHILFSKIANVAGLANGLKYRHLLIDKILDQAFYEYIPGKYDGQITLFRTKTYYAGYNDLHFGWHDIAQKSVKIIHMPCYPRGSLNEPFVQILADKLRKEINNINNDSNIIKNVN